METVTSTEFKRNFSKMLTLIEEGQEILITRHGKPLAVALPYNEELVLWLDERLKNKN